VIEAVRQLRGERIRPCRVRTAILRLRMARVGCSAAVMAALHLFSNGSRPVKAICIVGGGAGAEIFVAEQPFAEAAERGVLALPKCTDCGESTGIRGRSARSAGATRSLGALVRQGTIYSFSILRHPTAPYSIAYVTLDDGPTLMTRHCVDCPFEATTHRRSRPACFAQRREWAPCRPSPPDSGFDVRIGRGKCWIGASPPIAKPFTE